MAYADVDTDALDQLLRERDHHRVRERCTQILNSPDAPTERRDAAELALAQCLVEGGDPAGAAQIVVRIIQRAPQSWRAWHVNALIALSQGDWTSARECYLRAEETAPDSDWVLAGLGVCEAHAERNDIARSYFTRALVGNPASTPALQGLLTVCNLDAHAAEILPLLRRYLVLMPLDAAARLYFAKALRAAGAKGEALSEVTKVTYLCPDLLEAKALREELLRETP